jgi:hypothetical protein
VVLTWHKFTPTAGTAEPLWKSKTNHYWLLLKLARAVAMPQVSSIRLGTAEKFSSSL